MIQTKIIFFSKHQNKAEFKNLDDPLDLSSDFCGMDHQNSNFSLISDTFLLEAVEASRCYFLKKQSLKLKFPNP